MLVHQKSGFNNDRICRVVPKSIMFLQARLDKYELKIRGLHPKSYFSIGRFGNDITTHPYFLWADVINIHWVNRGFLSVRNLADIFRSGKKVVWTIHDSWAFTGGCHLPYSCKKYETMCGACPTLSSNNQKDLSNTVFQTKQNLWQNLSATIFTPSSWLLDSVRSSSLLSHFNSRVFRNPLDSSVFRIIKQQDARLRFGLPLDKKIILFGAVSSTTDSNKGFDLLVESLNYLCENIPSFKENHIVCIFGSNAKPLLPLDSFMMGYINKEHSMAELYSAADVFVLPSRSENLPYTIMEALSCGTPAVSFSVGGIPDLINNGINGYLAKCFDTKHLAECIKLCLDNIASNNSEISAAIHLNHNYDVVSASFLSELSE